MNQKKGHKNKKKTIAMLLVMAIFISILPDSFTASAAEAIKEAVGDTPALTMQFQINSAWGGCTAFARKSEGVEEIYRLIQVTAGLKLYQKPRKGNRCHGNIKYCV